MKLQLIENKIKSNEDSIYRYISKDNKNFIEKSLFLQIIRYFKKMRR